MRLDSLLSKLLLCVSAGLLTLVLPVCRIADAQVSTTSDEPSFEAAVIRLESPHTLEELTRGIGVFSECEYPTSHFFAHFVPLRILVAMTFDGSSAHVLGPEWLDSQLYSIDAKVEGDTQLSRDQMRPLLRHLLDERFHLKTHEETRTEAGYNLVIGKGGEKLKQTTGAAKPWGQILADRIQLHRSDLSSLAVTLSHPAGKPVTDKTGLTGNYDIDLRYRRTEDMNSNLPDIFTAVQEQLGLKLVPAKVPVKYFVIDHVDRMPADN